MGINLVWKLEGHGSWFENRRRSWILIWEGGVSWVIKITQTEAHSTWFWVSSPEFLFHYMQIYLFLKNFGKSSHLEILHIIVIFHGDSTTTTNPRPTIWGLRLQPLRIDAYVSPYLKTYQTSHFWIPFHFASTQLSLISNHISPTHVTLTSNRISQSRPFIDYISSENLSLPLFIG